MTLTLEKWAWPKMSLSPKTDKSIENRLNGDMTLKSVLQAGAAYGWDGGLFIVVISTTCSFI
jgi:hypothetical protein